MPLISIFLIKKLFYYVYQQINELKYKFSNLFKLMIFIDGQKIVLTKKVLAK